MIFFALRLSIFLSCLSVVCQIEAVVLGLLSKQFKAVVNNSLNPFSGHSSVLFEGLVYIEVCENCLADMFACLNATTYQQQEELVWPLSGATCWTASRSPLSLSRLVYRLSFYFYFVLIDCFVFFDELVVS